MARIELFYDIVSPYSYLAYVALDRYRAAWKLELVLRPAFLAGVMKAVGNVPPATLAQRAPYLVKDLVRLSRYHDVPLTLPDPFPGNTLPTMRFLTAVQRDVPSAPLGDLSVALWKRHWGEGAAVDTPEVLRAIARPFGDEVVKCVDELGGADVKELLKKATDEAVERGAFGFPAMFTKTRDGDDEMFFGQDRLPLLAAELGLPWHGARP